MTDNALKAISSTDDELRVGNHIVLFGDENRRDLEWVATGEKNPDGSLGDYFTKATQLESPYTLAGRLPVRWEHGLLQEKRPDGTPFIPGTLGYVDWSTAKATEDGVWVQRVLDRRNKYVRLLETLIDVGAISTSSEAEPTGIQKAINGEIQAWPLRGDSLTVSPVEWRMLSQNALQAAKALGLVAEQPAPEDAPEAGATGGASVKAATAVITPIQEDEMDGITEERLVELLGGFKEEVVNASKAHTGAAIEAFKAAQPAPPAGFVVQDELDAMAENPELGYKSLGEQLVDVVSATLGGKPTPTLLKAQKAIGGANTQVPADGGYLVQTDLAGELLRPVYEDSPLLQGMRGFPVSGNANSVEVFMVDESSRALGSRYGGVRAYRVAEGNALTSSKVAIKKERIDIFKVAVLAYATEESLQDAALLSAITSDAARNELKFFMADDVLRGTGAGMPLGILNSPALISVPKETGQAADTVVAENILKMWYRMPPANRARAVWMVNQEVEPQLDQMALGVGTGGALVYMPGGGLSGASYGTLKGRPVIVAEHMSALGDVGDIGLFDMGQYGWATKGGVQEAQSIHVEFLTDQTVMRFIVRYGGRPLWSSALTPYKGDSTNGTLSPFITLAERA